MALRWLATGAIAALIGGSSRQVVWIVPLIVLPYFAWLRRSDRRFLLAAALAWIFVVAGAAAMQRWFNHQPYAVPDPPIGSYFRGRFATTKYLSPVVFPRCSPPCSRSFPQPFQSSAKDSALVFYSRLHS